MKKIISFLLVICGITLPQMRPITPKLAVISEVTVLPSGNKVVLNFNFKIPYNKLIFEKNGNAYASAYSILLEIYDNKGNFILRQSIVDSTIVNDFADTDSPYLLSEGTIVCSVDSGSYKILPIFRDLKTPDEIKLKEIEINTSAFLSKGILAPLIVRSNKDNCNGKFFYSLANLGGNLPFDQNLYDILLPSNDLSLSSLNLIITNNEDTVFNNELNNYYDADIAIEKCNGKLILDELNKKNMLRFFVLKNISSSLNEGSLVFSISKNKKDKAKVFKTEVKWYAKPMSLLDVQSAIKALEIIENKDSVNNLLDSDSKDLNKVLYKYWESKSPKNITKFNPVMAEYYKRVDYAILNFSTIAKKNGALTDRGHIFVKFGKPSNIERSYNSDNKVIEIWSYESLNKKYYFVDKKGIGDFEVFK